MSSREFARPAPPRARPDAPALSVVVLSHQRVDLLRRTLRSVFAQRGLEFEVVVVDNASSDGSPEMVKREFPGARLIALERNVAIEGRNIGFRAAQGAIVLSLDNDVELPDPELLLRLDARFARSPALGALTLKITETETGSDYAAAHWWHPLPRLAFQDREFQTDHLNEAAVAFRSEALRQGGYYYESLFWGGEEWDLSLAMLDAGWELRYHPEPVLHLAPRGLLNHRSDPRHALLIRNRCWIALRRLPPEAALAFTLPRLVLWGLRALRHRYLGDYLRGIGGLLAVLPTALRERRAISRAAYRRVRAIQGQRPGRLLD